MFDKDFYPTPKKLAHYMASKIGTYGPKFILEPSAGKGDLIEAISRYKAGNQNITVDCVEKNLELNSILRSKGYRVVGSDFLNFETFSNYNVIIANPPFSQGDKHVLKMIDIAENSFYDCHIITLLNAETIKNPFSNTRKELVRKLTKYKAKFEYLDGAFLGAERSTDVEVVLVDFVVSSRKNTSAAIKEIFNKFTPGIDENTGNELSTFVKVNEIDLKADEIYTLIQTYQNHLKRVKDFYKQKEELDVFEDFADANSYIRFERSSRDFEEVLERLRINYWKLILNSQKFRPILTENAYQDLMKKINSLNYLDVSEENVMLMLSSLYANKEEMLHDTLLQFFDEVTARHQDSFSSNIYLYNGWKSNSAYKLNKKIILRNRHAYWPNFYYADVFERLDRETKEQINDILKVLKLVDPKEQGKWETIDEGIYENNVLKFKVFQKGTIHVWFKDLAMLDKLNYLVAKDRNWLPTEQEMEENSEAQEFIRENFPNLDQKLL